MRSIAFLLFTGLCWGQIAVITSGGAGSTGLGSATVPAAGTLNASGASCVIVNTVSVTGCGAVLTDSQGTATYATIYSVANVTTGNTNVLFAAPRPGGGFGAAMTWNYAGTACFPAMQVLIVSGTGTSANCNASAAAAVTNGAGTSPMTLNYTPGEANDLVVSSVGSCTTGTVATPSVGTTVSPVACSPTPPNQFYGTSFSYLIQSGGPTAVSEVWTLGAGGANLNGGIAAFKPGAANTALQGYIIVQ